MNAAGVVIKDEQWFDNAQLAMIRTWDNDGKQSGTWLEYNSLGQLLCKRSYDSKGREIYQELYTDNGKYQCRLKHTIAYDDNGYEYTVSKYELVGHIDRITGEDNRKFIQTAGKTGDVFWEISPIGEMYSERTSDGTCTVWTDKTKTHIITKAWNADNGRYELTPWKASKFLWKSCRNACVKERLPCILSLFFAVLPLRTRVCRRDVLRWSHPGQGRVY